jgi:phosphoenolpyruvate---glycerone phosphotransferase subunit DhaL
MTAADTRLDGDDFAAMIIAAADVVDANVGALSRLDAVTGDGDHGANAQRAMTQARHLVDQLAEPAPASVLDVVAGACGEAMAGASGAVFAAFFGGAARSIEDRSTVDALGLAGMLAAGLRRVRHVGGADVGDKSIVDALASAAVAAETTVTRTPDVAAVLAAAATAARHGAQATAGMVARVGRARYAESGGQGSADPGAMTIALLLESWAGVISERRRLDPRDDQPRSLGVSPGSKDRS